MAGEGSGKPAQSVFSRLQAQFRERPLVAWGASAIVLGLLIAIPVVVFVGGDEEEPANFAMNCSVYDSDVSVRLTLTGRVTEKEAENGCNELAAQFSGSGGYWRVGAPPLPDGEPLLVCALNAPEGESGTAMVEESPEAIASPGTTLCGRLAHVGWTQDESGGEAGPWQLEYGAALQAQEAVELEEQEVREAEAAEDEAAEEALYACEERAQATEEAELEAIEQETEALVEAAPESKEFKVEEEGWAKEEEVWARGEAASAKCRR